MASEPQTSLFSNKDETVISADKPHRGVNLLNDLTTREWLISTKSVWYSSTDDLRRPALEQIAQALRERYGDQDTERILGQVFDSVMLSVTPPRDELKAQHPATFSESDIERLIKFFTKSGERVLDPFLGAGSTLVACKRTGRRGLGIELTSKWVDIANLRVHGDQQNMFAMPELDLEVRHNDAVRELQSIENGSFQFVVTSPPYWSVLNKNADHKVKGERIKKGLPTNYSDAEDDLANAPTYPGFLTSLEQVFRECNRVLDDNRYIAVVVSDFRDKSRFYMFHADIAQLLEEVGFNLSGITILVQDSKTLYPYGMPHAFVSNIHHQYVVIARKLGNK